MKLVIVLLLLCLSEVKVANGVIAYDCEDKNSDISTVSIRDVEPCPEPESAYDTVFTEVTVIQRNEIELTPVRTCLVEITRVIFHCGMFSHSSIVEGGVSTYVQTLGSEECNNLHRYKSLKLFDQYIGGILINGTISASITMLGELTDTGACDRVTYHENGKTWKNVVITAAVKITTQEYRAKIKLEENEISLSGGVTCPYLRGYCMDTNIGETVWQYQQSEACDAHMSLLYKGVATKVTQKSNKQTYIVIEREEKIFALSMVKRVEVCGLEMYQTEHPRLLVLDSLQHPTLNPKMKLLPQNTDLISYVNSKFLYIEQAYKREMDKLYVDIIYRRCLLHREILRNRLLLAPFTPSAISQILQNEKGYVGRVLGEVLYIMKCVPKKVQIRRTEKCFHELPISMNNRSLYMAPITRIIQGHAEEIDCNGVTPPLYHVDNEWIGLTPYPTVKGTPSKLGPELDTPLAFNPIQPVGQYGLYTPEEVSKVQRILTFGAERRAVENILTRRVAGMQTEAQGYSTIALFDEGEIKNLAESTIKHLWGWFSDIGTVVSGFLGFYLIFRMLKYGVTIALNAFQLYKIFGCGFQLLASLWNYLTIIVMYQSARSPKADSESRQTDDSEAGLAELALPRVDAPPVSSATIVNSPLGHSAQLYPTLPVGTHWSEESRN